MKEIEKAIEDFKICITDMEDITECEGMRKSFAVGIEALEKQLTNGWIPVSERLPNEEKFYNVTIKTEYATLCEFCLFEVDMQKFYYVADGSISENQSWKEEAKYVIAWQPLPSPYEVSNAN